MASVQPGDNFEAVGGHTARITYGPSTVDSRTTIVKPTTAWEVLWYTAPSAAAAGFAQETARVTELLSAPEHTALRATLPVAVASLSALKRFLPEFYNVTVPQTYVDRLVWQPSLAARLQSRPSADAPLSASADADTLALLFVDLFVSLSALTAMDDCFDGTEWALGLVDVTSGMAAPSVLDLKLGRLRFSPLTAPSKIARLQTKDHPGSLVRRVGLRITGMRHFFRRADSGCLERDSVVGKDLGYAIETIDELRCAVRSFCRSNEPFSLLKPAATEGSTESSNGERRLLAFAHELLHFLDTDPHGQWILREMAFVSSSVLLCYDAGAPAGDAQATTVRLIDLARSSRRALNYPESEIGFRDGLVNLIRLLQGQELLENGEAL